MKKIINISLVCLMAAFALVSCSDAEEGLVKVTHYATFKLNDVDANNVTLVPLGTQYTEPGCVCMEGDEDITQKVVITGDVDSNTPGLYPINYTASNVDGFSSSATRTVIVYDPNSIDRNIGGTYTVADGTYRLNTGNGAETAYSGYPISVEYVAPGLYYINDYLGGYYDQRAGYGSSYAMTGYFTLNNDNSITALTADVAGWGDSADEIEASYDEATGNINLTVVYAETLVFYVTLTK